MKQFTNTLPVAALIAASYPPGLPLRADRKASYDIDIQTILWYNLHMN